ncbi:glycosyltransferase family 87 protein [Erythrobacter sp. R86502]|uniref:glycosyltransferase family 87 protein n=1 Tax=Erythrobacter sp. R86502 TaxID=3093846 RepID=UPI0036D24B82
MGWDAILKAEWLGPERARGYLLLLALVNAATLVFLLVTARDGIDRNGFLIGTDFISFWTSGRMLMRGAEVYDTLAHVAAQREFYTIPGEYTAFFYPPSFLPFVWPLGLMPYFPALAAWLLVTGAAWLIAMRGWFSALDLKGPAPVLIAAFPPVIVTLTHGQTSFLVAALLAGGLLLFGRRPWLAGVLIGLATIKPQLGLLVPVALLASGQWRSIVGAGVAAIGLAAFTAFAFGPQVWGDWFTITQTAGSAADSGSIGFAKMVSPFAGLRLVGVPSGLAIALQACVTLGVAAMVAWACWRRRFTPGMGALVLAGAPLATPFVLDYDLVLSAVPLAYLFARARADAFENGERITIAVVFASVAFARPLAINAGVPIMPLLLAALFVLVWRRVRREAPV